MTSAISTRMLAANLAVYGTTHALVDATSGAVIITTALTANGLSPGEPYYLVMTYNLLAFGFQPLFGRLADHWRAPRAFAMCGCMLLFCSGWLVESWPVLPVILAGTGNALFHVGGGIVCLALTPKRATAPGIYVAPGALGLTIGILVAKMGLFVAWPFAVSLCAACLGIWAVKSPEVEFDRNGAYFSWGAIAIVGLLLFTIVTRSFTGFAVPMSWKTDPWLVLYLTLAVVMGKALGGVLADRFGWITVSVGALVISAPLIAFGASIPTVAILGMLLFNMTMAVTLAAVALVLPGRPGFAFGLTCLAYISGMFAAVSNVDHGLCSSGPVLAIIIGSAVGLLLALLMLRNDRGAGEILPSPARDLEDLAQTSVKEAY
jgi:MFS transporter, FSR family, fosmidomycin resistance protein